MVLRDAAGTFDSSASTTDDNAMEDTMGYTTRFTGSFKVSPPLIPLSLLQRHEQEGDAADDIAAHVVKSAKLQGAL
jgi:hypothetical protein